MQSTIFPSEGLGFRRKMIAAIACVLAIVSGVIMAEQPYLVFAAFAGLIYIGTLTVNFRTLAWLAIVLQPAALIVPFFPGRPFWWELCTLLAWPSLIAFFLMNRRKTEEMRFDQLERRALFMLLGYVLVLGTLMFYRGVGFRALGGDQMGGRFYVQQVVLAILPILFIAAEFSKKQIVAAVSIGWVMSLTYLVSDFSFSAGGGNMQKILYFFEIPTDAINFELGYEINGLRRFQSLWFVGAALCSALLACMPLRDLTGRRIWLGLPLALGSLFLALLSGHRTAFIEIVATIAFLSIFQRYWSLLRMIGAGVMLSISISGLYLFANQLPMAVQRAVSFMPGIEVTALANDNALDTLNDRVEVLKLAVHDIPKYLVIGRGFSMERFDLLPSDAYGSGILQGYINGYFYNGLLGSLLKTGLMGFVCTGLFVFWISRMAWQAVCIIREKAANEWDLFDRICLLICAQWCSLVFFFYCLHGDAGTWAQYFALPASLIIVCRRQLMRIEEESHDAQPMALAS